MHPDQEEQEPNVPFYTSSDLEDMPQALDLSQLGDGWVTSENLNSIDMDTFLSEEGKQVLQRLTGNLNGSSEDSLEDGKFDDADL
jgi:hypothetical protein